MHANCESDRASRFFARIGLTVLSLGVFLLLAEGITRVVDGVVNDVPVFGGDRNNTIYTAHPYLYRIPRAGVRYGSFEINRHGFRGREFELPKPAGVFRILVLGGSAVLDPHVSGTDATWVA